MASTKTFVCVDCGETVTVSSRGTGKQIRCSDCSHKQRREYNRQLRNSRPQTPKKKKVKGEPELCTSCGKAPREPHLTFLCQSCWENHGDITDEDLTYPDVEDECELGTYSSGEGLCQL